MRALGSQNSVPAGKVVLASFGEMRMTDPYDTLKTKKDLISLLEI